MTIAHRRDGSVRKAALLTAREYHVKHIERIDEELNRTPGAVSTKRMLTNTRKWLEGMSTPRIRAQAQRIGLDPEGYESIDELTHAIMHRMGYEVADAV